MQLQFAHLVPHVWQKLEKEQRAGWVRRGIKNPETVAGHTLALLRIAREVQDELEFSEEEFATLLVMLEVHDWPEWKTGDEITLVGDPEEKKRRKFRRELAAMEEIWDSLGSAGFAIYYHWHWFETGQCHVARLARELDTYQAIEQAYCYEREKKGYPGLGAEFVRGSPPITHPALKARFARRCTLFV